MAIKLLALSLLFLLAVAMAGCVGSQDHWSFTINGDLSKNVNSSLYKKLENCTRTYDGATGIPLEYFLYYYGVYPVESVSYGETTLDWDIVAYDTTKDVPVLVGPDGAIHYKGASAIASSIIKRAGLY
jgi:hypothetical protein